MEQFLYFGVITACLISACAGFYIRHVGFILPGWIIIQFSLLVYMNSLADYFPKVVTGIGAVLLLVVSLGLLYVALFGEVVQSKRDNGVKA
ncbi:hypothetical protein CT690_23655 [Serratia plymuthica]|uniref:Uncharacterized protein n=2 Tax=Serratia plymuthica TaxID=82996 RepID=A0A318NS23_SERPL|nr:hypothetical protein CT690_23655 [Serratia plymuthica]